MNGDEVAQVYISYPNLERMPVKELKAFKRITIEKGGNKIIQFNIPAKELQKWDLNESRWKLYPGDYTISVGTNSQDMKLSSTIHIKEGTE